VPAGVLGGAKTARRAAGSPGRTTNERRDGESPGGGGRGTAAEPLPLAPSAGGFVAGALGSLADGAALRLEMPLPGDARLIPRRVRSAPVPLDGGEPASAGGTGWVSAR